MENLERIIAKIVEEANEKASSLLDDANSKKEEILQKAKEKTEASVNSLVKEYEVLEKSEKERIESAIELKARNIILEAKQNAIKEVFDKLHESILEISPEDMKGYILKTLGDRKLNNEESLLVPEKYMSLDLGIDKKPTDKIKSGFLIEKNGVFENYSIEALIKYSKDEIEKKIQESII